MGRLLKWFVILLPIFIWLFSSGSCVFHQYRIDRVMKEADGLQWGGTEKPLTVSVKEERRNEKTYHTIRIVERGGTTIHQSEFIIDWDMWGGGFVKAFNGDIDPDPEIVAWGAHEAKEGFFLDYQNGQVVKHPFSAASKQAHVFARQWREAYVAKPAGNLLLLLPILGYYLVVGLIWAIAVLRRRHRAGGL